LFGAFDFLELIYRGLILRSEGGNRVE